MSEKVNAEVEFTCTEDSSGKVSCRVEVNENGQHASCTINAIELPKGISAKISCSGDKELFDKIKNNLPKYHLPR